MANTKTASLVTITDLTDAPIGILSNESFILAADLNGMVGSFSGASTTLSIKLGGTDDSANWSVSAGTPVGITGSLVGKTYTVTAMGSDIGYVDLTASRTGFSNIVKRFSVAKAKQGTQGPQGSTGAQGKGISGTVIEYKASSSGTSTPADPWSSTVPSVADNQYLWTRTTINYTDGANTKAYSVGKMGAQGPQGGTGATGVGISSTSVTYQEGSSGTTEPTGAWSPTVPTVADNKFLWTKVVINYTSGNPTTSYSVGKMGAQGPQGAKGDTGAQGATGTQGPKGDTGVSITGVSERYLATASSSGVTTATGGWTEAIQTITATNKYLWNYEIISFSDGSSSPTLPVIIGAYGDKGTTGSTGRALTGVTEYYLASSSASGITRPATDGTGGWTTTMQVTTSTNKYLWNYEKLTWSVAPLITYIEPIIIGIHGDKGDTGAQGPQGIQGPAGSNGQSLYTWVKYADNASGGGMSDSPTGKTYIGLAYNKTTATESSTVGDYTWSLIQGPQGIQGPSGSNGQSLYTWIKYADTPTTGMSDSPTNKKYLGIAYNKTTSTESSTYADYSWSLIEGPQGVQGNTGAQGPQGIQGIPAEQYNVVPSVNTIIRKLLSPYISPTSMTFKVYKTTGNGSPVLVTSGVVNTIAYSTDGINFTNVHSSIQPTSSGTTTLTLNNATYNFARGSSVAGYKNAVCVRCISTIGGVEIGRITIGFSLDDALLEIAKIDGSVVKIDGSKIFAKSIVANEAIFGGSITANELSANAVTATKIAANAIEIGHISSGAASSLDLSSNNSIKLAVDGVQVGGRNLYVNTIGYTPNTPFVHSWTAADAYRTVFDGKIIHCKQPFKAGDIVTIQAESDAMWSQSHGPSAATDGKLGMWFYFCATPNSSTYTTPLFLSNDLGSDKTKFVATRVLPVVSGLSEFYISMRLNGYSYPSGTEHTANLWNIKLERGNKATDWTPATEDVDAKIDGVSQDVSETNVAIDQIISANATKQSELDTQINNLNLALTSLNTGVGENNTSTQGAIDAIEAMIATLQAQRSALSAKVTLLEDAKLNTDNYIQIGTVKLSTGREVFGVAVGKDVDILNPDGTISTFERSMTAITSNEFMILTGGEVVGVFDSTGMTSESVKVNKIVMGKRFEWSMTSSNAMVLKKGG